MTTSLDDRLRASLARAAGPITTPPGWVGVTMTRARRPHRRRRSKLAHALTCATLVLVLGVVARPVWRAVEPTRSIDAAGIPAASPPTVPYVEKADSVPPGDVVRYAGLSWSPDESVSFPVVQVDDSSIIGQVGLAGFGSTSLVLHRAAQRDVVLATISDQEDVTGAAVSADSTTAAWSSQRGAQGRIRAVTLPAGRSVVTLEPPASRTVRVISFIASDQVVVGIRPATGTDTAETAYLWTLTTNKLSDLLPGTALPAESTIGDVNAADHTILIDSVDRASTCIDAYTILTAVHRWRTCVTTNRAPPVRITDDGTLIAIYTTIDATPAVQVMRTSDARVLDRRKVILPSGSSFVSQPIWESDGTVLIRYQGRAAGTIRCNADLDDCENALDPAGASVRVFGSQAGQSMLYPLP